MPSVNSMHVVATAGHVDHGKSSLVTALTGGTPDRLAEERRRGLSIELGYCWGELSAPGGSGDSGGPVAFVDVPGHERFVATMLAGVGPVPAVLFVVAADDPWMPQAAEHLAALDGLGVTRGVLAVTRSDLADPATALAAARAALATTGLADLPAVAVSARTGAGLDELRTTLARVLEGLPRPDPDADVRLWVDRSFAVRGAGTVVTGTLPAGTVRVGDALELAGPDGVRPVRVRGLQSLERERREVSGVARVAVNLGGDVVAHRGEALLTRGAWEVTEVVDVRLTRDPAGLPREPLLHVGATAVSVRVRPLAGDLARLTLARPLPLRVGDRALLRDPGSRAVWGVRVLDPEPPALARRGDGARRAGWLRSADGSALSTLSALTARDGIVDLDARARAGVEVADAESLGTVVGTYLVSAAHLESLAARLLGLVGDHERAHPLDAGLPEAAAVRLLGLPDPALLPVVVGPPLRLAAGRVRLAADVPEQVRDAVRALAADLAAQAYAAPPADRLSELGLTPPVVAAAARAGLVLRLGPAIVLAAGADADAAEVLRALPQPFTTSEARQALGTSRRVVLPLLEHLDRTGLTVRHPDDRRSVRAEPGLG